MDDIAAERRRQIEAEGWAPSHDDEHRGGVMALAAAAYAVSAVRHSARTDCGEASIALRARQMWPWEASWWKPKSAREDLVRAAALIVAEIERLDRIKPSDDTSPVSEGGVMGAQPQNKAEAEIAMAMRVLHQAVEIMKREAPDLPETAIGAALINLGVQAGVRTVGPEQTSWYLRGCAHKIGQKGFAETMP